MYMSWYTFPTMLTHTHTHNMYYTHRDKKTSPMTMGTMMMTKQKPLPTVGSVNPVASFFVPRL